MRYQLPPFALAFALLSSLPAAPNASAGALARPAAPQGLPEASLPFTAAEAEHLFNRAGFGATPERLRAATEAGLARTLEALLAPSVPWRDPFFAEDYSPGSGRYREEFLEVMGAEMGEDPATLRERFREQRPSRSELDELLPREQRQKIAAKLRVEDRLQLEQYSAYWLEGLLAGHEPLRERLTLFWMGLLTSSNDDVKNSYEMIAQHQFLRQNALSSYRTLLTGIARDPAMLEFLDNDENRKRSPNENFARELLELFTLGEGHYTEADVLAAARAFTGWTDRDGVFVFQKNNHDRGEKTFLGRTGDLSGEDVLEILLQQPRCARYLSDRLITYLEGEAPRAERGQRYGDLLLSLDYAIAPYLRALFSDAEFYRPEIVGNRIQSPLDFLVGSIQRLGVEPPVRLLELGLRSLGQRPFYPPSVKGWDEGRAWITTSAMLQRANMAGVLLGTIGPDELLSGGSEAELMGADSEGEAMGAMAEDAMGAAGSGDPSEDAANDQMDADEMAPEDTAAAGNKGAAPAGRRGPAGRLRPGSPAEPERPAGPGLRERLLKNSELLKGLRAVEGVGWQPRLYLSARLKHRGAHNDQTLIELLAQELLARPLEPASQAELVAMLRREREQIELSPEALLAGSADGEHLVRRMAHAILSLPEAQLH